MSKYVCGRYGYPVDGASALVVVDMAIESEVALVLLPEVLEVVTGHAWAPRRCPALGNRRRRSSRAVDGP